MREHSAGDGARRRQVKSAREFLATAAGKIESFDIRRHTSSEWGMYNVCAQALAAGRLLGGFEVVHVFVAIVAELFEDLA
jgi:hypothetical protein